MHFRAYQPGAPESQFEDGRRCATVLGWDFELRNLTVSRGHAANFSVDEKKVTQTIWRSCETCGVSFPERDERFRAAVGFNLLCASR